MGVSLLILHVQEFVQKIHMLNNKLCIHVVAVLITGYRLDLLMRTLIWTNKGRSTTVTSEPLNHVFILLKSPT